MTFTFSVRGRAEDGSRVNLHVVAHVTAGAIDFSTDPPAAVTGVREEFGKAGCAYLPASLSRPAPCTALRRL
jgi:hypothetical protein